MPCRIRSRLVAIALALPAALASTPAAAFVADCDLTLPRFTPDLATPATSSPSMTRIPREIAVEHAGFPSPDAAARCFGARYHDRPGAEYITFIVWIDDAWGYLTPGKSPRRAKHVSVADLYRAAYETGHKLHALAHTHPYGMPHFSAADVATVLASDSTMYVTNWRNETYRADGSGVRAYMQQRGFGQSRMAVDRFLRKVGEQGFPGAPVR